MGSGKEHNRKGKGNMLTRGGLLTMLERVQRQLNLYLSYRGQNMRTCSTVSTVSGHEGHLSVLER